MSDKKLYPVGEPRGKNKKQDYVSFPWSGLPFVAHGAIGTRGDLDIGDIQIRYIREMLNKSLIHCMIESNKKNNDMPDLKTASVEIALEIVEPPVTFLIQIGSMVINTSESVLRGNDPNKNRTSLDKEVFNCIEGFQAEIRKSFGIRLAPGLKISMQSVSDTIFEWTLDVFRYYQEIK